MALKLGELLVNERLITRAQLEEALQAQVIFGGKLGTILIEMGLLGEKVMGNALRQLLGFPCVQPEELERVPANVIAIIPRELAERFKAVPVSATGRKLTLAMADPRDIKAIDEISFRTGYIILPVLALEVRLYFALERYYGIKRPIRYIAPPKFVTEEGALPASRAGRDKAPSAPPSGPVLAPARRDEIADFEGDLSEPGSEQAQPPAALPVPPRAAAEPVEDLEEVEELDDEEVTLADTARRLVAVTSRDDVADALIAYLGAHFSRAVLFMVVAGQVTGWRAMKDRQPIPAIDQFQLPLNETSVLKTAVESNSFFLGPIPASGANLALTTLLGKPAPTTAVLLPLSMLGRVVGLIYIDDPTVNLSEAVVTVQKAAGKALLAFELLILQSKILRT